MVRVGVAASETFAPTNGIIQGCALSTTMLNCLMAVWAVALRHHVCEDYEISMIANDFVSVYLDTSWSIRAAMTS